MSSVYRGEASRAPEPAPLRRSPQWSPEDDVGQAAGDAVSVRVGQALVAVSFLCAHGAPHAHCEHCRPAEPRPTSTPWDRSALSSASEPRTPRGHSVHGRLESAPFAPAGLPVAAPRAAAPGPALLRTALVDEGGERPDSALVVAASSPSSAQSPAPAIGPVRLASEGSSRAPAPRRLPSLAERSGQQSARGIPKSFSCADTPTATSTATSQATAAPKHGRLAPVHDPHTFIDQLVERSTSPGAMLMPPLPQRTASPASPSLAGPAQPRRPRAGTLPPLPSPVTLSSSPSALRRSLASPRGGQNAPTAQQGAQGTVGDCAECGAREADMLLLPCGHLGLCEFCAERLKQTGGPCPTCSVPVSEAVRVFKI
eukprot:m51a1_g976 hypothetical protein (370) ;mRNA; f:404330-405837